MEILKDVVYSVLSNRVKILNSYKITDRNRMREILYAIQHKHPEIKFNRDYDGLICEWVAHNRLYKWGIKPNKTIDVDLAFNESWWRAFLYNILGM